MEEGEGSGTGVLSGIEGIRRRRGPEALHCVFDDTDATGKAGIAFVFGPFNPFFVKSRGDLAYKFAALLVLADFSSSRPGLRMDMSYDRARKLRKRMHGFGS